MEQPKVVLKIAVEALQSNNVVEHQAALEKIAAHLKQKVEGPPIHCKQETK